MIGGPCVVGATVEPVDDPVLPVVSVVPVVALVAGGTTVAQYFATLSLLAVAARVRLRKATECRAACEPLDAAYAVQSP